MRAVAEAEAFRVEAIAKAEAAATVAAAEAEARALETKGLAEARATEAKGLAEAQAIDARARALEAQAESVLAQELIHLLPAIAREYAQAIGSIDTMTVVSADGTAKVAGEAMGNLKGLLDMARDTVGIDLVGMLNGAVTGGAAGSAAGRASVHAEKAAQAEKSERDLRGAQAEGGAALRETAERLRGEASAAEAAARALAADAVRPAGDPPLPPTNPSE